MLKHATLTNLNKFLEIMFQLTVMINNALDYIEAHPGILNNYRTQHFGKMDLFLPSGDGKETPTLLGPLERANLNQQTNGLDGNRSSFLNAFSSYLDSR
jgi:hypothetical protein